MSEDNNLTLTLTRSKRMSTVIQVLETMASDASLVNEENINALLEKSDINVTQKQAFTAKNTEKLAGTVADLSTLIAYAQVLPVDDEAPIEDEQEDDNTVSSKLLASSF